MEGAVTLLEWTGRVNNRQIVCLEGESVIEPGGRRIFEQQGRVGGVLREAGIEAQKQDYFPSVPTHPSSWGVMVFIFERRNASSRISPPFFRL